MVVFGDTIDAYTCINVLLELGVNGRDIVLVFKPSTSGISCFNNADVESAVGAAMAAAGVVVHHDAVLATWTVRGGGGGGGGRRGGELLASVTFECGSEAVEIECMAVFCYAMKGVDLTAFKVSASVRVSFFLVE